MIKTCMCGHEESRHALIIDERMACYEITCDCHRFTDSYLAKFPVQNQNDDQIIQTSSRPMRLSDVVTIAHFDRCGCGHRGTEHQHLTDDSPSESTGPCDEALCPCLKFQRKMFIESKTGFGHIAQNIYRTSFRAVEKAKFEGPASQSEEFSHWLIANGWEVTHGEEWQPEDTRLFCIEAERLIRFGEKR